MKRILALLLVLFFCMSLTAYAEFWDNPVLIKSVKTKTIFTYYKAILDYYDVEVLSPLPSNPSGYLLDYKSSKYGHHLYLGYIQPINPNSNIGVFGTHDFGLTTRDGSLRKDFESGDFYIQDYDAEILSNKETLDIVYSNALSDTVSLGASFTYFNEDIRTDSDYLSIVSTLGVRDDHYTRFFNTNHFGGTVGASVTPNEDFNLRFAVAGEGYYGRSGYTENRLNALGGGEISDFDKNGWDNGYNIGLMVGGTYDASNYLSVPFYLSYSYAAEWWNVEGNGTITPGNIPYFRSLDYHNRVHRVNLKAGVDYSPIGNSNFVIPVRITYRYKNNNIHNDNEVDTTLAGGSLLASFGEATFSENSLGAEIGVNFKIMDNLKASIGFDYDYTFINTSASKLINDDGTLISAGVNGDGFRRSLSCSIGLNYTRELSNSKALNVTFGGTIPIFSDADYIKGMPATDDEFPVGFVTEESTSRAYSIYLGISYAF
jgi:hypothetical protein